jgi:hypothetical protein
MGKSITPNYRVEYKTNGLNPIDRLWKQMIWNVSSGPNRTGYGSPTVKNLEIWRKKYNASFEKCGVNFHVSESAGYVLRIFNCRIVNQRTENVVAEFKAPSFDVS